MPFKAHFYRQILLKSQPFWAAPRPGAFRGLALKKIPGIMFSGGFPLLPYPAAPWLIG